MKPRERRILESFFTTIDRSLPKEIHEKNFERDARVYNLGCEAVAHGVAALHYLYECGGNLADAMSAWA